MTDTGAVVIRPTPAYEDFASLKKYINFKTKNGGADNSIGYYDPAYYHEINMMFNVTTTGTADEIEVDDGIAISNIGKTEVTVQLTADGDGAATNGKTYTFVYEDSAGTQVTAVGTGTATLNGTPVEFVPAITDCYQAISFSADAGAAGIIVYAKVAAGITLATLTAAATESTEIQLSGVGHVYGRSHTEHGDADSKIHYMEYLSGAGLIKYGIVTQTTTSVDEIPFFVGTYSASTDIVTASTVYVKDFYRLRRLWSITTPTANSHEWLLTDASCANVDGSGGDIYGIIIEGQYESIHTLYQPPTGYDAWVGQWNAHAAKSAPADSYTFEINYKQDGGSIFHTEIHEFVDNIIHMSNPVLLEEQSDVTFYVSDLATADVCSGQIRILEVKRSES